MATLRVDYVGFIAITDEGINHAEGGFFRVVGVPHNRPNFLLQHKFFIQ
ncbi:MAG: hypothetical protein DDT34_01861 [Firmicutes bacterium]|nr:hypothetical protein [Bacillota bacterium]